MPVSAPPTLLRVAPKRASWSEIDAWLAAHAAAQHLPEPCAYALRLAVEELFLNTVSYGCCESRGTFILLSFRVDDGQAIVVMEDDARPFNPLSADLPPPYEGPAEREGGLGLLLTREMLTTLDYEPLPHGNRLTLKKRLG